MKINEKILQLVKSGLKATMLTTLSESQINSLHSRLVESKTKVDEQITKKMTTTYEIPAQTAKTTGADIGGVNIKVEPSGIVKATEIGETKEIEEKFESKKQQKYFFAKCGEGKTKEQKKWCKMADEFAKKTNFDKLPEKKTETNEEGDAVYQKTAENLMAKVFQNSAEKTIPGFTIGESNLEKQITQLVEKHISPKMSKKDFINTIKNIMVESPKKYPSVKRNLKLPIMGLNEDENELPDWLTAKAIGF